MAFWLFILKIENFDFENNKTLIIERVLNYGTISEFKAILNYYGFERITQNTWPKVVKLDYNRLYEVSLEKLVSHEVSYKPSEYYYEEVYEGFLKKLKGEG